MKKLLLPVLCVAMILSLAACGKSGGTPSGDDASSGSSEPSSSETLQIPNPFEDCSSLEEAGKIAGFDMTAPTEISGYEAPAISAIPDEMIQLCYTNGDKELTIRKGAGSGDISGDHNTYSESGSLTVDEIRATTRGEDGKIMTATWTDGDFTFSVTANQGVTAAEMTDLIGSIQ